MGKYADLADKKIKEKEDVNKDSKRTREEEKKKQVALISVYHKCKSKSKEFIDTVIKDLATSKSGTKISWHESESANMSFGFSVKGGCHFQVELESVNSSDFSEQIKLFLVCKFVSL